MQIKRFVFNPFQVNSYLLFDETKEAILIDAAMIDSQEENSFSDFVSKNNLDLKALLNTHGHMDHIAGTNWIKQEYNISPQGHESDDILISSAEEHAKSFRLNITKPENIKQHLTENSTIFFGKQKLEIRHIPGHSLGGLAFIHHESKSIFCGDSLFQNSIGRTDLPGGNYEELISAIKEQLLTLPNDYTLYPGHGPESNIGYEKSNNPFLR